MKCVTFFQSETIDPLGPLRPYPTLTSHRYQKSIYMKIVQKAIPLESFFL